MVQWSLALRVAFLAGGLGDGRSQNLSWLIVDEALSHVVGKTLSLCVSDSCSPRCTSIEADISDLFVSL